MRPVVSVIIPTYMHADFVVATLESVFAQTDTRHEIIVVNDGSPDETAARLRPFVDAGHIRYVEQANAGQAAARNRGIALATGEYLALLDDDDLWPADKLAWQVDYLERHRDVAMVAGVAETFFDDGRPPWLGSAAGEITFDSLFDGCPIVSPGQTLIRMDLLRKVGGMNEAIWGADDWDLWFRLAHLGRIHMDRRVGLRYRAHAGNASNRRAELCANAVRVADLHLQEVPRSARPAVRKRAYRFLIAYAVQLAELAKADLRAGRIGEASRQLAACRAFLWPAVRDPYLCATVARSLLPKRRKLQRA